MNVTAPPGRPAAARWSGALIAALLLVAAGLLFAAIYLALPSYHHYYALIAIGILALVFGAVSYFAEAFSRNPVAQRSAAWGFFGMGFAVLIVSIVLGPSYGVLSTIGELISLVVVILVLVVAVALAAWRARSTAATQERLAKRAAWQNAPASSALDYAAAHAPSVPQVPGSSPADPAPPRSP